MWLLVLSFFAMIGIKLQACNFIKSRKGVLRILQNSQENTCARVSFLINLQTLLKKRLWDRCFPVNFVKFLRTPFLKEHLWTTVSVMRQWIDEFIICMNDTVVLQRPRIKKIDKFCTFLFPLIWITLGWFKWSFKFLGLSWFVQ